MKAQYQTLIADLRYQVAAVFCESLQGDEAARQWLVTGFPGHLNFLLEAWQMADDPPRPPPEARSPEQRREQRSARSKAQWAARRTTINQEHRQ